VNYDLERLRALEIQVTALKGELNGHVTLCDGRWRVMRLMAALLSAVIAAAVSLAVSLLTR
jgi:hypothetical protein